MSFTEQLQRPSTASTHQEQACNRFLEDGLPTSKNEEWKFTNVAALLKKAFETTDSSSISKSDIQALLIPELEADIVAVVNGKFHSELSSISETLIQGRTATQALLSTSKSIRV